MIKEVANYIARHSMLPAGGKVLVAVSGGADSVALLRVLRELGYVCEAAHCNFCLRGAESERDEDFVRSLCSSMGVLLHTVRFDTEGEARRRHVSVEMAARDLRYAWFEELRRQQACCAVAVAHHRDDSVETFLLNLLRGTGINGLQGIRPVNGHIVRPLLCVGRKDILDYLHGLEQGYVTDSTNLQTDYLRNKVRLLLLPCMNGITPAASENILKAAARLADAASIYNSYMADARMRICRTDGSIDIARLLQEAAPQTVLFELLHPLGFNSAQVEDIFRSLKGQPGKTFASASGWRVLKDRDLLLVERHTEPQQPHLEFEEKVYDEGFVMPRTPDTACLDADKLHGSFLLRLWRKGDQFVPFGMKGMKKVSDYMTDRKFPLLRKERQWVLCCGDDIVWLVGERVDNRFRVDKSTRRVIVVRMV